ncbi:homocysteine S-methyltransferase family protein [Nocardiopsis alkaliphila]|nr:homocysteine S-methyltransferase family protein [Nocardiopsis alkaliphila]
MWTGSGSAEGFGEAAAGWCADGAVVVGGCCRTGPDHIRSVRSALNARFG